MAVQEAPHDVLVVGWFPAADDQIAGRFVADQAAALLASGRARPVVASFEPLPLHGDVALRTEAADAWPRLVRRAATDGLAVTPRGAYGPAGVPVARLGVAHGHSAGLGRTHQVDQRTRALRSLLDGLPDRSWDVVHAHVGYPIGAAAAVVAADLGLPLVLTEHATFLDRQFADEDVRAAYRAAAGAARVIVAVSRVLADRIAAEFPELSERIVVIPNAVDVGAFTTAPAASRDPDELLWVGYRREIKGIDTLLAAFAAVRAARPSTTLRLVGRSPTEAEEAAWRRIAGELGVSSAVRFDPPADRSGVAAAMARAALFVHPSRVETMGVVAAEALAAGLPVVATDSGGVTEVLGEEPDELGAIVPRDDPKALARAILATLERRLSFDPERLRRYSVERFGSASVARRIADLYDNIAPARSRRDEPAAGIPPGLQSRRIVVVGFDRPLLDDALTRMPDLTADLAIVTSGNAVDGRPNAIRLDAAATDALRTLIEWRGRARRPGLTGLIRAAPRWLGRRLRRRLVERRARRAMRDAVIRALTPADGGAGGTTPPLLVCLGGVDIATVAPLADLGLAAVAPGGIRWLADWLLGDQADDARSA